jgi:hypothetical protein
VRTLCFSIEVIVLPVSQVERAPRFYVDQIGFKLDVDYCPTDALGSLSSLRRDPTAPSRSAKDSPTRPPVRFATSISSSRIWNSHAEGLLERGVKVSEIRHKTPVGACERGIRIGLDLACGDRASFANFSDPDGNGWVLQERGCRNAR